MKKKIIAAVLALLAVLGPLVAPIPAAALGAAGSGIAVDGRCPESASGCIYRLPDNIAAARHACYRTEREERGIPGDRDAYVAWWNAHAGTPERADWNAAWHRCNDQHQLPGGKWDWANMIYVGEGLIG